MNQEVEPLDVPMYSPAMASRLVGLEPSRVRRWLQGYEYTYAPKTQYASFVDLIDLLFVKKFVEHGISVQRLRKPERLWQHPAFAVVLGQECLNALIPFAVAITDFIGEVMERDERQNRVAKLRIFIFVDAPEATGIQGTGVTRETVGWPVTGLQNPCKILNRGTEQSCNHRVAA